VSLTDHWPWHTPTLISSDELSQVMSVIMLNVTVTAWTKHCLDTEAWQYVTPMDRSIFGRCEEVVVILCVYIVGKYIYIYICMSIFRFVPIFISISIECLNANDKHQPPAYWNTNDSQVANDDGEEGAPAAAGFVRKWGDIPNRWLAKREIRF